MPPDLAQPAVYRVKSNQNLISSDALILARTQVRAIQYCIETYGGFACDWDVVSVQFSLDRSEAVEIGRAS